MVLRALSMAVKFSITMALLLPLALCSPCIFSTESSEVIDAAISGLVSSEAATRDSSAEFLLSAPSFFREKLVNEFALDARELATSLPQQIDKYTTVDTVLVTERGLGFHYRLLLESHETGDYESIKEVLRRESIAFLCSNPGSALYMLYDNEITRSYRLTDGSFFFETSVAWRDCQSR
jgi:hypothetical protein